MKKSIALFALLAFTSIFTRLMAQKSNYRNDPFKGQALISTGIGVLPSSYLEGNQTLLPLELALEYRFNKKIGIAAAYSMTKYQTNGSTYIGAKDFDSRLIAARFIGHIAKYRKYDFYGGIMVGLLHQRVAAAQTTSQRPNQTEWVNESHNAKPKKLTGLYAAMIGARIYVGKRFSIYAEGSFGLSLLSTGIGYTIRN